MKPSTPHPDTIVFAQLLFAAAHRAGVEHPVFETRILNTGREGTISGYAADAETLANLCATRDGTVPGIYVTPNAVVPECFARAASRLKSYTGKGETTGDNQIARRLWLLLDFDAVRPAGVSSTDYQHTMAIITADVVRDWLCERGWPDPIANDSGNGAHLLYRVDLPNDDDATALIKRCLNALAARFDDEDVKVDTSVYNAARIWKMPGTMVMKGDSTTEQPHRRAALLERPDELVVVTREQLEALAVEAPTEPPKSNGTRDPDDVFVRANACDVRGVLERLGKLDGEHPICPGCGTTGDSSVAILDHGLKCSHARCADRGRKGFRTPVDLVMEVEGCTPIEAVRRLGDWFGFEVSDPSQPVQFQNFKKTGNGNATASPPPAPVIGPIRAVDLVDEILAEAALPIMPIGLPGLDALLGGGFTAKTMNVIVAPSGRGKTSLATQISARYAESAPALYYTAELTRAQLVARVLSQRTGYSWRDVIRGAVDPETMRQVLAPLELDVLGRCANPIGEIVRWVDAALARGHGAPLVVIDYMQLVADIAAAGADVRLANMLAVRALLHLAETKPIFMLVLSQGNRASSRAMREGNGGVEDYVDAGAETAALEQSASTLIAIVGALEDGAVDHDVTAMLAKSRMGRRGKTGLRLRGPTGRWEDLTTVPASPAERKAAEVERLVLATVQTRPGEYTKRNLMKGLIPGYRGDTVGDAIDKLIAAETLTYTRIIRTDADGIRRPAEVLIPICPPGGGDTSEKRGTCPVSEVSPGEPGDISQNGGRVSPRDASIDLDPTTADMSPTSEGGGTRPHVEVDRDRGTLDRASNLSPAAGSDNTSPPLVNVSVDVSPAVEREPGSDDEPLAGVHQVSTLAADRFAVDIDDDFRWLAGVQDKAARVVELARQAGVKLWVADGQLRFRGHRVPNELRTLLTEHKVAIIALLTTESEIPF